MKLFVLISFIICSSTYGQIISPASGNKTWCPGEIERYEVLTPGSLQTNCNYKWVVTNGTISGNDFERTVSVIWNDSPSTGTLKVTLTNCTEATNTSVSETYAIRSLAGRVPANAIASQQLPYCSTAPVQIQVDEMFLLNTGGATGITQQRADGYEWTLPAGWTYNGQPGTVRSTTRYISITPNACAGGDVKVKEQSCSCDHSSTTLACRNLCFTHNNQREG